MHFTNLKIDFCSEFGIFKLDENTWNSNFCYFAFSDVVFKGFYQSKYQTNKTFEINFCRDIKLFVFLVEFAHFNFETENCCQFCKMWKKKFITNPTIDLEFSDVLYISISTFQNRNSTEYEDFQKRNLLILQVHWNLKTWIFMNFRILGPRPKNNSIRLSFTV